MQSSTLPIYKEWLANASKEAIAFVDLIYHECEQHYSAGGDIIIECWEPGEILEEFESIDDVKEFIGLKVEQALNQREGNDDDWQVGYANRHEEW